MIQTERTIPWNKVRSEALVFLLLTGFAFLVNAGIQLKGLFMDDLYMWSCYGEQSFTEYVFPMGSTRFRFVFYLLCYIELALLGNHITWFVPVNILLNSLIAYTVYRFAKRLSGQTWMGILSGILYLVSRMSYYQISQVYGLMESLALWAAIGILYFLYRYLNERENEGRNFAAACLLYFAICFIHERYMVLMPLLLIVSLLKNDRKRIRLVYPLIAFALVQGIRLITIGTVSPAGTGGTNVSSTFSLMQAIRFAIRQVLYLLGINHDESYLSILSFRETAKLIKLCIFAADLCLLLVFLLFLWQWGRNRKQFWNILCTNLLFAMFIGACIVCSSVTIRVEVRWVYVSMTAAWLWLSYMFGIISRKKERIFTLAAAGLIAAYALCVLPTELYYRSHYDNLYYWNTQAGYNSLAEETYGKYGKDILGKEIYIIGNTFGVSAFNAETFFKTFDPERKAEGTTVTFVDSIRDFGQVQENMVILEEDPKHHCYNEITDFVRDLKWERIYGCYPDGFVDESAKMRILTGETGKITLSFMYPGMLTGEEMCLIRINGTERREIRITDNIMDVVLEAEPNTYTELTMENNFYIHDAQEQRGEKRFSMVMTITTD